MVEVSFVYIKVQPTCEMEQVWNKGLTTMRLRTKNPVGKV